MKNSRYRSEILKLVDKIADVDIFVDTDGNEEKYLYIHLKGMDVYRAAKVIIRKLSEDNLRFATPSGKLTKGVRKYLIWVPFNQKLNYLVHGLDEVAAIKG